MPIHFGLAINQLRDKQVRLLTNNEMEMVSGGLSYEDEARQAMEAAMYAAAQAAARAAAAMAQAAAERAYQAAKDAAAAAANSATSYFSSLLNNNQVAVSASACITVQGGNISSQTCQNSDGTTTTQVCTNTGASTIVNNVGAGLTGSACVTTTTK